MSDEPETTFYPTGFVRRARLRDRAVLAQHEAPTQAVQVPLLRDEDAIGVRAVRVRVPRAVRVAGWIALASVLLVFAFLAGQRASPLLEPGPLTARPAAATAPSSAALTASRGSPAKPETDTRAARDETAQLSAGPVRDAVAALASGDYDAALQRYRALASAHPGEDAFDVVADVLERRLAERCAKPSAGGARCATP